MNTLARNFSHTFRRFLTASVLNIIGLAIAFASFFVIMTQVDYDLNFNKGYKDYEKIFRVEAQLSPEIGWMEAIADPLGEALRNGSPYIKSVSLFYNLKKNYEYEIDGHSFSEPSIEGFGNFMDVFQPEMLNGSADALNRPQTVLISQSMAMRTFGTTDVVGKIMFQGKQADNKPLTIGGVYKDFPENSEISDFVCISLPADKKLTHWGNWNINCFLRLSEADKANEISNLAWKKLAEGAPEMTTFGEGPSPIRLTPITDIHFSKVGNKSASGRGMSYLLVCISFLIVIIATINFMNFSLAETPIRVRSINTQKILGATTWSLRSGLVIESILISLIAFAVSLVMLLGLHDSGVEDLVSSDLSLFKHPYLLATTCGISILMGILAGLYPSHYVTSFQPALALKGSFGLSPKGRKLRTGLVCVQFFVSFMLVIAIGIMYAQSHYIRTTEYGYDKDAVIVGELTKENRTQSNAIASELSRLSGVSGVAFSENLLGSSDGYMTWYLRNKADQQFKIDVLCVDENYFDVMGIHLTEGRRFKAGDKDVFIANETARKAYDWFAIDQPSTKEGYPIIGFCNDVKYKTFRSDNEQPLVFMPISKEGQRNIVNVRISVGTDRVAVIRSLQKAMEKFTPGHDFNFRFMDQVLDNAYRNELRFTKQILLFSLLAIVISIIGVFGLTMFESEYRRKEIGIRKIFGSTTGEILRMFNKRYLYILIGCFIVAAPFGWWIGQHWLEGFAERTPIRAWIFLTSFLLVTAITMITVTVQSWKNANENPANSIKTE